MGVLIPQEASSPTPPRPLPSFRLDESMALCKERLLPFTPPFALPPLHSVCPSFPWLSFSAPLPVNKLFLFHRVELKRTFRFPPRLTCSSRSSRWLFFFQRPPPFFPAYDLLPF